MKHKVLQDFANVCCQKFVNSPGNYDLINYVILGSGKVTMDFLTQSCTHNKAAISPLFYCASYYDWLGKQCKKHNLAMERIIIAQFEVELSLQTDRTHSGWMCTSIDFSCSSRIGTQEKEYCSQMADKQEWGLGQILINHFY